MATNLVMPALGYDMTHGAIARWLKKEGDAVKQGEAIAEVDTEKATVEIQSFGSGVLQKILVAAGNDIPVGTVIGIVGAPGEKMSTPNTSSMPVRDAIPLPPLTKGGDVGIPTVQTTNTASPKGDGWIKASPLARRIAEIEGVALADIAGTGPEGRITEKDVKSFLAQRRVGRPAASPVPPSHARGGADGDLVELTRIRQTIARRMAESKTTVPHFYVTFDIDMTNAMQMREQLNNLAKPEEKISVNDIVLAAVARTLVKWRNFNASFQGDKLSIHAQINIAIAVAREDGLLTPVMQQVDKKSLKEIAREAKALAERTRANKMLAQDLVGSTFTVSNLGMFGVEEFSAIINPPEAAILAVGAVRKAPFVVEDQVHIAQMMKATISVDHRVADGAQAAQMMRDLKLLLENPVNLLLKD